jgi:hypothetical protein
MWSVEDVLWLGNVASMCVIKEKPSGGDSFRSIFRKPEGNGRLSASFQFALVLVHKVRPKKTRRSMEPHSRGEYLYTIQFF